MITIFSKDIKKVKDFIKKERITQGEFAKKLGISRTALTKWFNGTTTVSDGHWLLIEEILAPYTEKKSTNAKPFKSKVAKSEQLRISGNVTHVPYSAFAGFSSGHNNPMTNEELEVWTMPFIPYLAYCFEVRGDSMRDTLQDGELVFTPQQELRRLEHIQNGYVYVVETVTGDYLIKRVYQANTPGMILLQSDNYDYKDFEYHYPTDFKRLWKVKHAFKWDISLRDRVDREIIDMGIENQALKLDRENEISEE